MSKSVRTCLALWLLLAIVVFNVRFDWQARVAAHAFVRSQIARQQQGRPALTLNGGFRPMVRDAAFDGARWSLAIAALGAVMTLGAATRGKSA